MQFAYKHGGNQPKNSLYIYHSIESDKINHSLLKAIYGIRELELPRPYMEIKDYIKVAYYGLIIMGPYSKISHNLKVEPILDV